MSKGSEQSPTTPETKREPVDLSPEERAKLEEEAKSYQDGLSDLLDRIDSVKEEYQKLQTENKLLQEWIGNSIQRNAQAKPR